MLQAESVEAGVDEAIHLLDGRGGQPLLPMQVQP